ncbi:sulfotransferase family 1, cytosolic sulfotransferase 5 [Sinocyclocheilus grahami]|uniref:sulfotransferase family 1, cytosolic sulfotransferase 5 n=1 Tax=Sinocyclocheilus grahami TaxID=75366 RepID=UPI0007ACD384|nr:PREDICTED: sulfotransferase 1 family member D1-like [Sinocyclocheilus grahami]
MLVASLEGYTVHMARNPKGTVVSYYHFDRMNLHQLEPGPWPQYLEKFMSGQLGWGSWYDHVKGYWRERHNKKILYIFYEDMKVDPVKLVTGRITSVQKRMLHLRNMISK